MKMIYSTTKLKIAVISVSIIIIVMFLLAYYMFLSKSQLSSHGNDSLIKLPSLTDVDNSSWKKLEQKKIYFGHQSIGYNIVSGIKLLMKDNTNIKLNIVESKSRKDYLKPVFGHSPVGKNEFPDSKNVDFSNTITNLIGDQLDIAFYKYCYIDINENTNVEKLFSAYKKNIESLKRKFPNITFVHVTDPLSTVSKSPMVLVRNILGRNTWGYRENKQRNLYNNLLRKEYEGKEPIFDLAKLESTTPNGKRYTYSYKNKIYFALDPVYASDHAHLNEIGQRYIAGQLLIFLANLK